MAIFDGMHLTEKGALLINKLQSGANLTITRASAGDGYYDEGESAWDLEELKHPRADCTCRIAAREMLADGTTVLTIYISADSSIVPLREIGIHASDPDEGEILYASTNAGDYPDYLPPGTTATTVVRKYKVCIETGEAAEVTIENLSVAEVTREEFENHTHPQLPAQDTMGVLDGITAERVRDWDTAAGGGAVVADGSITMAKLAPEVAVEVNKAHEHSNKSVLDTITEGVVSNAHEHSNKSVLDDIEGNRVSGWDIAASHASSTSNPHGVTKSQVGLGSVPNVTTNNQTPTYTTPGVPAELVSGEKLGTAFGKIKIAISRLISHLANTGNPHGVTKEQIGLGNVTNESKRTMFRDPEFTGWPITSTPPTDNRSTRIATTEFVHNVCEEDTYSLSPQRVGTWFNGMPIWRQAYKITFDDISASDYASMLADKTYIIPLQIQNETDCNFVPINAFAVAWSYTISGSWYDREQDAGTYLESKILSVRDNVCIQWKNDEINPPDYAHRDALVFVGWVEFATPESNIRIEELI